MAQSNGFWRSAPAVTLGRGNPWLSMATGAAAVLQHLPGDDQVEQLDCQIAVITTDASGWAIGA